MGDVEFHRGMLSEIGNALREMFALKFVVGELEFLEKRSNDRTSIITCRFTVDAQQVQVMYGGPVLTGVQRWAYIAYITRGHRAHWTEPIDLADPDFIENVYRQLTEGLQ